MLLPTFSSLPLHKFYEGGKGGVRVRQHLNHKKTLDRRQHKKK